MKILETYNKFIECILSNHDIKTSWEVFVLDRNEWDLYSNERDTYVRFLEKYLEPIVEDVPEAEKEWDYIDPEEHMIPATCEASKLIKKGIELIEDEIKDVAIKEVFNKETSFLREVISSSDAEYLILLNHEEYSTLMNFEIPTLFSHETIHIIDLCKEEKHKGDWIVEREWDYANECIDKVEENIRKHFLRFKFKNNTVIDLDDNKKSISR